MVKEDGRWLIASLHVSTNIFDNIMLDMVKKYAAFVAGAVAIACLVAGLALGWLAGRKKLPLSPVHP